MRATTLVVATAFALVISSAFAQEMKTESKHDKDVRECKAEAAKAPVKHPADVMKVQRDAFNVCMRRNGHATPRIRP